MARRKVKVDMRELADAFQMNVLESDQFLDLETGKVIMLMHDSRSAAEEFFDEVEIGEDDDVQAKLDGWLDTADVLEWQVDDIKEAILIEMDAEKRFLLIPTEESYKGYNDMVNFIETVDDKHLAELLSVAINGKGAFRRFKDVLSRYPDERERWFVFQEQRVKERVLEWLDDEDIEVEG